MSIFVQRLQELLDEKGMTIRMLSKEIDVPNPILYAYKSKDFYPNIEIATKIAEYFGCSLNFLFGIDNYLDNQKYKPLDLLNFYKKYVQLLEKNNISHYFLVKNIGLNNSSITKWKNGSVPKLESLIKIANYFGVSIDYLVGRADV